MQDGIGHARVRSFAGMHKLQALIPLYNISAVLVQFPHWSLSAARAIAVVQYLISKGVPPQRLAAAGFGEFQPIDPGDSDEANQRNRRIELKITEK